MEGFSPKLPLAKTTEGIYNMNRTAAESINQDLKMLLLTNPGERIMLPDYGAGLRAFLFEQATTQNIEKIRKNIETQISRYMNFITVKDIGVKIGEENENVININVTYTLPYLNTTEEININSDSN